VSAGAPPLDLAGRTCVVTGASDGIGRATATALARGGARVVLACRSPERGEAARRAIAAATGNAGVELRLVDLASQASIRRFAAELAAAHPRIDVLVNNAGIWSQQRRLGPDGIELTWATNVLGYFLLTELLLDTLRRSAPARIVNVASELAMGLDLGDVEFRRRPYRGPAAYAQSKQANRMLTWALARRLEGSGVTANAVHPGGVNTGIFRKSGDGLLSRLLVLYARLFSLTPERGAETVVWLASSPELAGVSGCFWASRKQRRCGFRDPEAEEALWALCASMTGLGPQPKASAQPNAPRRSRRT